MNRNAPKPAGPFLVFPVEVTLAMTHPARLRAHHAAILYALLAEAQGDGSGDPSGVPDGEFRGPGPTDN